MLGLNGTGTAISETLINNGTAPYTVNFTITADLGNCTDVTTATVVVKPSPVVQSTPKNSVLCDHEDLEITLSSVLSGTTINWTLLDGSNMVVDTGTGTDTLAITQAGLDAGNYTLQYTGTNNGCTSQTYTLPVTVN